LRLTDSAHHSETALIFGSSAYAASDSQRTPFTSPRATELISSGTAEARSVLRGEAVASSYIRSFWTFSNLDVEQPLVVDLSLDWFYRLDMGSDALPVPYESAQTTLGIELSSRENATLPYKRAVRLTGDNELTEQDTYTFSLVLPPGETRTLLFGVATATSAYSVPLPAPLALLAGPLLVLAAGAPERRRRVAGRRAGRSPTRWFAEASTGPGRDTAGAF